MLKINTSSSGWLADISLFYEKRGSNTKLVHREQIGPLMVQRPFYPEIGIAHTYLLHPPGGVVGGDQLNINIHVASEAHSLITTPGATKFYRSSGATSTQTQRLSVDSGGFLEWLPQENIFFPNSQAHIKTQVNIHKNAHFIGWEMNCFGRPVLNEIFTQGLITGRTNIQIDGKLLLSESIYIDSINETKHAAGMRNYPMLGNLYIYPASDVLEDKLRTLINEYFHEQTGLFGNSDPICGITEIDGLLVIRYLGYQTEPMMACFSTLWQHTRQHWLGTLPEVPRIWAT